MVIPYGNCVKQKITLILELVSICCFILQISDLTKKMFCWFSVRRLCLLAHGLQNKHPNYQEL